MLEIRLNAREALAHIPLGNDTMQASRQRVSERRFFLGPVVRSAQKPDLEGIFGPSISLSQAERSISLLLF